MNTTRRLSSLMHTLMMLPSLVFVLSLAKSVSAKMDRKIISFDSHPQTGIIAIVDQADESRLISISKKDTTYIYTPLPVQADNLTKIFIAEVTGDDRVDIIVKKLTLGQENYATLFVAKNLGNGKWADFTPFMLQPAIMITPQNVKVHAMDLTSGDLNGDKKPDLVFLMNNEAFELESVILYTLNLGKGQYSEPKAFPVQEKKACCIAIGDMNLDKIPDFIYTTNSGWLQVRNNPRAYETESTLWFSENRGKMQFDKPRGLVMLPNYVWGFEDIACDAQTCTEVPHLILFYKPHAYYKKTHPGNLYFLRSDHPVLKPTLIKGEITWKVSGVTKNYEEYKKATPWTFDIGRENEILKEY